jgi:hypothetical protein
MGKNMKERLMPFFITLVLMVSMIVILPSNNVMATWPYDTSINNDGAGDIPLTCGDELTIKVTNGSLWPETNYYVAVWNGSAWNRLCSSKIADEYGDIELTFRVPGWNDLGVNPVTNNGTGVSDSDGEWNVSIVNASSGVEVAGTNTTITITNLYDVYYKVDGSSDRYYNFIKQQGIDSIDVYVRNWTGYNSGWVDPEEDETFTIQLFNATHGKLYPTGSAASMTNGKWPGLYIDSDYTSYNESATSKETYVYFNVSDGTHTSSARFPILLNMTADVPTGAVWGDEITFTGYLKDGQGNPISGYGVRIYAHNSTGLPVPMGQFETQPNGKYSISVDTGTGETGCAGNWYVGTYSTGGYPRVNTTDELNIVGFIPYATFEVATKNEAKVDLETTDDIITGFNQTINISVYNSSWMNSDDDVDMYQNMMVHITGVDNYNWATGETYSEDDIVKMTTNKTKNTSKYQYYEFDWTFNETGTVTIWVSYENNLSMIAFSDTVSNYYDSYYDDRVGLLPNVTGTTTFDVVGASDINIDTTGMPTSVTLTSNSCDGYVNLSGSSTNVTITVMGDTAGTYKNASIDISGCGVDISIKEDDPDANDGTYGQSATGEYWAFISPKTAGTITITATNSTDDVTITKDYSIAGLTGTVTTSVDGDKKIICGSTEKITATITNGQYAEVWVSYYDNDWSSSCTQLNWTVGDNTAGEGLNGIFEFTPDDEDLENVGYIVVAATAGSQNMYDIIEVVPINDLVVEVTTPAEGNQTLTVGMDQDVIVEIKGPTGAYVTADSPEVTGYLIYEDYDKDTTGYTIEFSNYGTGVYKASLSGGGDGWLPYAGQLLIEVVNASGAQEHNGSTSLDVDYATITYSPGGATAGILMRNITVEFTAIDANGNPIENEYIWFHVENNSDPSDDIDEGFEFTTADPNYVRVRTDEDGAGEFDIQKVGDLKTWINGSMQDSDTSASTENTTLGKFEINYPVFTVEPDTIYLGQSNTVEITAKDYESVPIAGINLTFISSVVGIIASQPDPVQTDSSGMAILSVTPEASGKLNVTIARDVAYVSGQLNWTDAVITDTYVTVTSMKTMKISVSKTPVYQGDTFTVTVTSNDAAVSGAAVEFAGVTVTTDATGKATFTAPDPGVESVVYTITAEKAGFLSADKSITVIKIFEITVIGPSTAPKAGETFTVTVIAKGTPLAGATVTFNGKTSTSGGDGKLTLTAPSTAGDYPLTASYGNYEDYTMTVTVAEGSSGVPGFELLTLVIAIGVAFILLRRRR